MNIVANDYKKVIAEKKAEAARLMSSNQLTKCSVAIHTAAAASAAAGAVPIPVVDAVPITTVQVSMVIALGNIFDRKITESAAKGLIGAVAATFVGRNLVKLIPVFGWGVSAAVAGGVTEAVGWTLAVDMANNAKKAWESSDRTAEDTCEPTTAKESERTEENEPTDIIGELEAQAEQFISGQKNPKDFKEDLEKLCRDIETWIDELPTDHPLLKYYDKLFLLTV
ncbi:DUF697 domain-containing protein [Pseudoflavonifractor phocaeensis]|uniref:DUF697 domain-containing protein n=1 Tax=Pseudoflavonifractor phocaeensis TaxID=1870988 RepID=UPI00195AB811|nr:DUF697 domain-containing protein [Pseudoflavonifractor phocaeensis]